MPIVQEAFDIPANIAAKILTGEYRRIGGVVRHAIGPNKGQIVKYLDPVNLKVAQEVQGIAANGLQFAKNNKKSPYCSWHWYWYSCSRCRNIL